MEESLSAKELAEEHCREGFRLAWVAKDTDAALQEFRTALEIWPASAQAHCQIGQIHFSATEPNLAEALCEFLEATRVAPEWSEGHLWCGNVLQEMLKMDEAAARFKEAMRLTPGDARTYISFGICLIKQGKYADAIAAFQQGIALKPAYGEMATRMMLADALRKNGQVKEALSEWKTVASMKAVWDYEQGEPERAKEFLAQYG